jgi:glycosyltransferase involved in cell wall biosynthesis
VAKNCIHAVFHYHPHGDIYAAISPCVNGARNAPIVPHMINLPVHDKNLRESLSIPSDAIVFGGYGGATSFSIPFVHKVVHDVAKSNPHIYFLFANFNRFCDPLPNIIYLDAIIDLDKKVEFINTCDAMLHARSDGETFGIAVGEFSSMNKPVITTRSGDSAHIEILGSKGTLYTGPEDLTQILTQFKVTEGDWNAYREYTPAKVMGIFNNIFLV